MTVVAFAMVVLTYGFETSFFHYTNKEKHPDRVLSTGFISLLITSVSFLVVSTIYSQTIANIIYIPENPNFICWLIWIIVFENPNKVT